MKIMWSYILMFGAIAMGAFVSYVSYRIGLATAGLKLRLAMANKCKEEGHNNPPEVLCPCQCGGTLDADGRNTDDTRTFLLCHRCKCLYHAGDSFGEYIRKTKKHLYLVKRVEN